MKLSEMRSSMQNEQMAEILLIRWLLIALGFLLTVAMGYWIGTAQRTWLYLCVGLAVLSFVTMGMRQRAWVLIPLGWSLFGSSLVLPLPLSIRQIGIMLATCAYVGYRILARADTRQKRHVLDFLIILNLAWLLISYIRHPVGFRAFGTETIGGRPYLEAGFAAVAYWVLLHMPDSAKSVSRIPYFMLVAAIFVTGIHIVSYVFPSVAPRLFFLYSGVDVELYLADSNQAVMRLKGLSDFGMAIVPLLCAYYPPRTLFDPRRIRFYMLLLGLACILESGFRNSLLWVAATITLAALFHRGWRELLLAWILGGLLLCALVVGQGKYFDLPLGVQRTLTFLPGAWSPVVVDDAEKSSQWRFDLWQRIIRERVIKNWWFGDGLGYSGRELQIFGGQGGFTEDAMVTGAFHNGPLTAIRCVGIVGLAFLYCLMIGAAVYSVRCVQRCRGTILFPASIFVATNLIWVPVHFTFVFGSYETRLPEMIFMTGLVRLLIRMSEQIRTVNVESAAVTPAVAPRITLAGATG
jgi:hypothetical protein